MKRFVLGMLVFIACSAEQPAERYGFIARLGRDTISVESVTRRGNKVTSDEVDRFPRVRQRHTEIELAPDGGIRRLVMDIVTPSEPDEPAGATRRRERDEGFGAHHQARLGTGTIRRDFATRGGIAMAHLPQMYSLYELYFAAALGACAARRRRRRHGASAPVLHRSRVRSLSAAHRPACGGMPDGKLEISHDWLAGIGEATVDSSRHLLSYSGAGTTYKVDVTPRRRAA